MSESKSRYYALLSKTLKKYNLTINDYKKNPYVLFERDAGFRQYVYNKFSPPGDFTWFGKSMHWLELIKDFDEDLLYTEDTTGTWSSSFSNYFHSIKTADTLQSKKQKTEHISSDAKDSQPSTSKREPESELNNPSSKKQMLDESRVTNKGGIDITNNKRPSESADNPNPAKKSSTTNVANKSLKAQASRPSTDDKLQTVGNIPGGTSEVNQQQQENTNNDFQIQTNRGNDHNQRGTLQGEAGNLKVQKALEKYGIVKVNMSHFENNSRNNKIFIFKVDSSTDANKLMRLLNETYTSGQIFSTTIEICTDSATNTLTKFYLIGWKLYFNLGFTKLYSQLGRNHGKTVVYLRELGNINIEEEEEVHKLMCTSFQTRFENDTQLLTLAEHVEVENKKREQSSSYTQNTNNRKRKLPLFD